MHAKLYFNLLQALKHLGLETEETFISAPAVPQCDAALTTFPDPGARRYNCLEQWHERVFRLHE